MLIDRKQISPLTEAQVRKCQGMALLMAGLYKVSTDAAVRQGCARLHNKQVADMARDWMKAGLPLALQAAYFLCIADTLAGETNDAVMLEPPDSIAVYLLTGRA